MAAPSSSTAARHTIGTEEMRRYQAEWLSQLGLSADEQAELLGLLAEAGPPNAETHLNLSIAYGEMGLSADAILEAAEALRLSQLSHDRASVALHTLLDPDHLHERIEFALDVIRNSTFQN